MEGCRMEFSRCNLNTCQQWLPFGREPATICRNHYNEQRDTDGEQERARDKPSEARVGSGGQRISNLREG